MQLPFQSMTLNCNFPSTRCAKSELLKTDIPNNQHPMSPQEREQTNNDKPV